MAAATLGENSHIRGVTQIVVPAGKSGVIGWYVHGALTVGAGRIVSAVSLCVDSDDVPVDVSSDSN